MPHYRLKLGTVGFLSKTDATTRKRAVVSSMRAHRRQIWSRRTYSCLARISVFRDDQRSDTSRFSDKPSFDFRTGEGPVMRRPSQAILGATASPFRSPARRLGAGVPRRAPCAQGSFVASRGRALASPPPQSLSAFSGSRLPSPQALFLRPTGLPERKKAFGASQRLSGENNPPGDLQGGRSGSP